MSTKPLFMRLPRAEGRNEGRPFQGIDTCMPSVHPCWYSFSGKQDIFLKHGKQNNNFANTQKHLEYFQGVFSLYKGMCTKTVNTTFYNEYIKKTNKRKKESYEKTDLPESGGDLSRAYLAVRACR